MRFAPMGEHTQLRHRNGIHKKYSSAAHERRGTGAPRHETAHSALLDFPSAPPPPRLSNTAAYSEPTSASASADAIAPKPAAPPVPRTPLVAPQARLARSFPTHKALPALRCRLDVEPKDSFHLLLAPQLAHAVGFGQFFTHVVVRHVQLCRVLPRERHH